MTENPFVASTYKNILAHVAAYALSKQVVRLEEPVTSIISVPDQDKYSAVEVRTTKGSYSFDEVIVTTPLGWLKSNPRAFDPPLTSRVSQAIEHVSYGNLEKIYVTFPSAWWEQPVAYTNGIIVNGAATHRSPVNHSASFTHWVSPRHPGLGNAQAVSLASLPPSVAHPTLLFYTYGATSKHNVLELSKLPTIEAQHAYLDAFLRPYYTTLPHFAPTDPACVPTAFHATTWSADPYAGYGSYSNFQVDATDVDRDIEAMRDGMPERRVWFAGEHTAPFVATGTTTGAYWAGEEVARRVLEAYGRERTDASTLPERPGEKKKVAKRSSEKWGQANGWAE